MYQRNFGAGRTFIADDHAKWQNVIREAAIEPGA